MKYMASKARKKVIIHSKNPHWCINYLRNYKQDNEVDELVGIIVDGYSTLSLIDLGRMFLNEKRFEHLCIYCKVLSNLDRLGVNRKMLPQEL